MKSFKCQTPNFLEFLMLARVKHKVSRAILLIVYFFTTFFLHTVKLDTRTFCNETLQMDGYLTKFQPRGRNSE
jgi:hypothetical protein